jgi:hypothetical protein
MQALTVCQPYASLIVGWEGIDPADLKRVENRRQRWSYRGPLLVHAGKSTAWLATWDGVRPAQLPMGMLVGSVDVVACLSIEEIRRIPDGKPQAWLKYHVHAGGPFCILLRRPRRLLAPIPFRGMPGLFDVPQDVLAHAEWDRQCRVCGCTHLDACRGGCSWVEEDLCSRCAGKRD